jgi:hypothetical protein
MLADLDKPEFDPPIILGVADEGLGFLVNKFSELFTAYCIEDHKVDDTLLMQPEILKELRIILCDQGLVIEDILEPSLEGLQSSEVYYPILFVKFLGIELEANLQSVAMKEATMRKGFPLPEGTGESN